MCLELRPVVFDHEFVDRRFASLPVGLELEAICEQALKQGLKGVLGDLLSAGVLGVNVESVRLGPFGFAEQLKREDSVGVTNKRSQRRIDDNKTSACLKVDTSIQAVGSAGMDRSDFYGIGGLRRQAHQSDKCHCPHDHDS